MKGTATVRRTDLRVDIYIPPDLKDKLKILPRGTISRACREALWAEVKRQEALIDEMIQTAFEED